MGMGVSVCVYNVCGYFGVCCGVCMLCAAVLEHLWFAHTHTHTQFSENIPEAKNGAYIFQGDSDTAETSQQPADGAWGP